jgi:hypothetical protein
MLSRLNKQTAAAAATVLIAGAAFTAGSLSTADAGAPAALSKAQVKKIASKQAKKEIKKAAPTLSVGFAKTAGSATTAGTAAVAGKVGTTSLKTFGADVATGGSAVLASINGVTLTGTCPAGAPTLTATSPAGRMRVQYTNGSNVTSTDGSSNWTTGVVNDTADNLGSGFLSYTPGTGNGTGTNAFYGWRSPAAGTCSFFGSMIGG